MPVDREQIEKFHAEAKRIRKNFRYIQQDLKRTPENIDLLRQRDSLKKRYNEIQKILNDARASGTAVPDEPPVDAEAPPSVDMSIFEPKPFEVPAAVAAQKSRMPAASAGARFTVKDIRTIISVTLLVIVVPFFYLYFVKGMRFYEVPTRSMEPTLMPGDRIVAVVPSHYERGDIVVLPDPNTPGDFLVKRLVALGNDTVEIMNRNLFVNGQPITEPYLLEPIEGVVPPLTVAPDSVYLLGDNRNNSEDSRAWASNPLVSELKGRVLAIYSPSTRRGFMPDQTEPFGEVRAP